MRFYLDENFPLSAAAFLTEAGHEIIRAIDRHPHGTGDEVLFQDAQEQQAVFLTTDKDFFHTIPFLFPDRSAPSVVVALARPNRETILLRLKTFLAAVDVNERANGVYLVTDRKIFRRI